MNGSIKLKQRYDKQQKKESAEFKSDTPTIFEQDIFKMNELTTSINKKKYVKKKNARRQYLFKLLRFSLVVIT